MDINNLTIVQRLALNTCWASYIYNNPEKSMRVWQEDILGDGTMYIKNHDWSTVSEIIKARTLLHKNKNCWTFKKSFYNRCHKLAWPSVKLPGYTKQQAIAEFREVIEFVKSRYEKNNQ